MPHLPPPPSAAAAAPQQSSASTQHSAGGAQGAPPYRIQVRRIYDPALPDDGARILLDRLWPRGVSKERAHLTLWLKEIAPTTALRQWFGHDPARWDAFQHRYRAELAQNPAPLHQLVAMARSGPLTLLFGAKDTTHNAARVVASVLTTHLTQP